MPPSSAAVADHVKVSPVLVTSEASSELPSAHTGGVVSALGRVVTETEGPSVLQLPAASPASTLKVYGVFGISPVT
ncbi:hypothetical protein D3C81_969260 [compost metagenome]